MGRARARPWEPAVLVVAAVHRPIPRDAAHDGRARSPGWFSILITPHAAAGLRRVSLGGALYRRAMAGLVAAAEAMRVGDLPAAVRGAVPGAELGALLPSPGAD